jgi:hypothetical protein
MKSLVGLVLLALLWWVQIYVCFAISTMDNGVQLRMTIRDETLQDAPSCQHSFSQVELLNMVRLTLE